MKNIVMQTRHITTFFQKLIEVVNKIAPLKTVRIKNVTSEWFDREIAEKLSLKIKHKKKS